MLYFIESVPMVTEIIDQVLALHPGIKWFHIGGDEVRSDCFLENKLIYATFIFCYSLLFRI